METLRFETGKTYIARSVCDYDCIFEYEIIKRTEKTLTCKRWDGQVKRYKIKYDAGFGNFEYFDDGNYSFHPIVKASNAA